ncbi:MAG: carboxypeptidase-like regulatory domain-containing protein [Gaiellaceae bacterium]
MRFAALTALVLAALAVCSAAGGTTTSGLRGTVTRGPIVPVCKVGEPCDAPAAKVVLVFRRNGQVARTTTDAKGRYRIALAPGTWAISLTRTGIGNMIYPRQARVVAHAFRLVDLSIDTGIR